MTYHSEHVFDLFFALHDQVFAHQHGGSNGTGASTATARFIFDEAETQSRFLEPTYRKADEECEATVAKLRITNRERHASQLRRQATAVLRMSHGSAYATLLLELQNLTSDDAFPSSGIDGGEHEAADDSHNNFMDDLHTSGERHSSRLVQQQAQSMSGELSDWRREFCDDDSSNDSDFGSSPISIEADSDDETEEWDECETTTESEASGVCAAATHSEAVLNDSWTPVSSRATERALTLDLSPPLLRYLLSLCESWPCALAPSGCLTLETQPFVHPVSSHVLHALSLGVIAQSTGPIVAAFQAASAHLSPSMTCQRYALTCTAASGSQTLLLHAIMAVLNTLADVEECCRCVSANPCWLRLLHSACTGGCLSGNETPPTLSRLLQHLPHTPLFSTTVTELARTMLSACQAMRQQIVSRCNQLLEGRRERESNFMSVRRLLETYTPTLQSLSEVCTQWRQPLPELSAALLHHDSVLYLIEAIVGTHLSDEDHSSSLNQSRGDRDTDTLEVSGAEAGRRLPAYLLELASLLRTFVFRVVSLAAAPQVMSARCIDCVCAWTDREACSGIKCDSSVVALPVIQQLLGGALPQFIGSLFSLFQAEPTPATRRNVPVLIRGSMAAWASLACAQFFLFATIIEGQAQQGDSPVSCDSPLNSMVETFDDAQDEVAELLRGGVMGVTSLSTTVRRHAALSARVSECLRCIHSVQASAANDSSESPFVPSCIIPRVLCRSRPLRTTSFTSIIHIQLDTVKLLQLLLVHAEMQAEDRVLRDLRLPLTTLFQALGWKQTITTAAPSQPYPTTARVVPVILPLLPPTPKALVADAHVADVPVMTDLAHSHDGGAGAVAPASAAVMSVSPEPTATAAVLDDAHSMTERGVAVAGSGDISSVPSTPAFTRTLAPMEPASRVKPVLGRGIQPLPGAKRSAWWDIDAQVEVNKRTAGEEGSVPATPTGAVEAPSGDVHQSTDLSGVSAPSLVPRRGRGRRRKHRSPRRATRRLDAIQEEEGDASGYSSEGSSGNETDATDSETDSASGEGNIGPPAVLKDDVVAPTLQPVPTTATSARSQGASAATAPSVLQTHSLALHLGLATPTKPSRAFNSHESAQPGHHTLALVQVPSPERAAAASRHGGVRLATSLPLPLAERRLLQVLCEIGDSNAHADLPPGRWVTSLADMSRLTGRAPTDMLASLLWTMTASRHTAMATAAVECLHTRYRLMHHLASLRSVYLMEQGGALNSFLDAVFDLQWAGGQRSRVLKDSNTLTNRLRACLSTAAAPRSHSTSVASDGISNGGGGLEPSRFSVIVSSLDSARTDGLDGNHLRIWYELPRELESAVNDRHLETYQAIFTLLLMIRQALYQLQLATCESRRIFEQLCKLRRLSHSTFPAVTQASSMLHSLQCLHHCMSQFALSVHSHMAHAMVVEEWATLVSRCHTAAHPSDLLRAHEVYLSNLTKRCLLDGAQALAHDKLVQLFHRVTTFSREYHRFYTSVQAACEETAEAMNQNTLADAYLARARGRDGASSATPEPTFHSTGTAAPSAQRRVGMRTHVRPPRRADLTLDPALAGVAEAAFAPTLRLYEMCRTAAKPFFTQLGAVVRGTQGRSAAIREMTERSTLADVVLLLDYNGFYSAKGAVSKLVE